MGVYIKDREMPKECKFCFLVEKCEQRHYEMMKDEDGCYMTRLVKDDCPLVEITAPHGDLIDRGELELDTEWDGRDDWYTAYSKAQISDAPVIIEAEGVPRKWWEKV
jgi:hypothetical protein